MPYLWDRLQDLGMCVQGAMGPVPLSCTEIQAWSAGTGKHLDAWEFQAIRAASRAYVNQTCSEEQALPYGDTQALADEDVVDDKLSQMLDRLARPLDTRG